MKTEEITYWLRCGIPWKLIDATFDTFLTDTQERVDAKQGAIAFCKGESVFLIGCSESGTGKSHLAAACLREVGAGVFVSIAELMTLWRATYTVRNGLSNADLLNTLKTCLLLVLDEIGATAGGNDEISLLDDVIAFRHDRNFPTILLTNNEPDTLASLLGFRLMDRINQSCIMLPSMAESVRRRLPRRKLTPAPATRFNGVLPESFGGASPAGWSAYLESTGQEYVPYEYARGWMKAEFRAQAPS